MIAILAYAVASVIGTSDNTGGGKHRATKDRPSTRSRRVAGTRRGRKVAR